MTSSIGTCCPCAARLEPLNLLMLPNISMGAVVHILKYLREGKHVMICGIVCRIAFILFGLWSFLAIFDLLCFPVLLVLLIVFLVGQSIA